MLVTVRSLEREDLPPVWCANTFFYKTLEEKGYKGVKRWTMNKKVPGGLFSREIVLIPIHLGMHWCCGMLDFKLKKIALYDSMGCSEMGFFKTMREYLQEESQDKLETDFDFDGWVNYAAPPEECPQQNNCCDCGVFTLRFAEYLSRRVAVTDFSQDKMQYFRKRTALELLAGELLPDK
jgi:sentrin-specific protease 1